MTSERGICCALAIRPCENFHMEQQLRRFLYFAILDSMNDFLRPINFSFAGTEMFGGFGTNSDDS